MFSSLLSKQSFLEWFEQLLLRRFPHFRKHFLVFLPYLLSLRQSPIDTPLLKKTHTYISETHSFALINAVRLLGCYICVLRHLKAQFSTYRHAITKHSQICWKSIFLYLLPIVPGFKALRVLSYLVRKQKFRLVCEGYLAQGMRSISLRQKM